MTEVFGKEYADTYDIVYGNKDYEGECDAILKFVSTFGDGNVRRLLDLGCGTGRHAIPLSERGYEVFGVDQSEAMLARARQRAASRTSKTPLEFQRADIRSLSLNRTFDAALIMFSVLGYMTTNEDLLATLGAARRHVRDSGLLIADIWYGPAVTADPPGDRMKEIDHQSGRIIRFSSGRHFAHEQCCTVAIRTLRVKNGGLVDEKHETHKVRYFFPLELELALRATGFRMLALRNFPNIDEPPSLGQWAAAFVAKAEA